MTKQTTIVVIGALRVKTKFCSKRKTDCNMNVLYKKESAVSLELHTQKINSWQDRKLV